MAENVKIIANKSDLVAIADVVRSRTGTSGAMTLEEIKSGINGITTEPVLESLEVTENGTYTPDDGVDGYNPITVNVEPTLQNKSVAPTTTMQEVTADSGYDGLNTVTIEAIPVVDRATPAIIVNSDGLIIATTIQQQGYVTAGPESTTKQLAFQEAKTITPTTINQVAVLGGYYTGGDIIVQGDSNLVGENIVKGKSIFGIAGTAEAGGGNTDFEDAIVAGTLTEYTNDKTIKIGNYAFAYCVTLKTVSFPACTSIGSSAFMSCSSLTTISFPVCTTINNKAFYCCFSLKSVNFPVCTTIGNSAFERCTSLKSVSFPACTSISGYAFYSCSSLKTVNFPICTTIGNGAFQKCYNLLSLYLGASTVCTLSNSTAFTSTPIAGYTTSTNGVYGSIFVPASLVNAYKTATNWTYFADRITAIEGGEPDSGEPDSGEPGIITFIIQGVQYQAEQGMTWEQWINSTYNVDNYILDPEDEIYIMDYQCNGFVILDNNYVQKQDIIQNTIYDFGW